MNEWELDSELEEVGQRVRQLSKRVTPRTAYQAHLRGELLHRQQELLQNKKLTRVHSAFTRFSSLKRLTVIAPPALLAAVACLVLFWALQISGHQRSQEVEAAPIAGALMRTAPTVTSWQWTLRQNTNGRVTVQRMRSPLGASQRLYIVSGRSYLFSGGKWNLVVPDQAVAPSAFDWQWAIASIASKLADKKFTSLGTQVTDGRVTVGIKYAVHGVGGKDIEVTAWLDRKSGLVIRLERSVSFNKHVIEHDSADYSYVRKP